MGTGGRPGYRRATVVGGGVIGISWTALFLAHGLEVTVCDPLPDVAERVRAGLREIAPTLAQLGLSLDELTDSSDALRFDPDAASAVAGTDVVQENGPERPEVKQQLWSAIEAGARANALLASSSSGIPASVMSQAMRQPGRLVIGHPVNPPHLVPLVEVVPSPGTDPEVVDAAVAFYRAMGKQPQVLSREIPGFVANRSVSDLPSGWWTWRPGRLHRAPGSGHGDPVGDPGPAATCATATCWNTGTTTCCGRASSYPAGCPTAPQTATAPTPASPAGRRTPDHARRR